MNKKNPWSLFKKKKKKVDFPILYYNIALHYTFFYWTKYNYKTNSRSAHGETNRKNKVSHTLTFLFIAPPPFSFSFLSMCLLFVVVPSFVIFMLNASQTAPGSVPAHHAHFNDLRKKHLAFIFSCNWQII